MLSILEETLHCALRGGITSPRERSTGCCVVAAAHAVNQADPKMRAAGDFGALVRCETSEVVVAEVPTAVHPEREAREEKQIR